MASCSSSSGVGAVVVHGKIPKETRQFRWTLADFADLKGYSKEMMEAIRVEFEMGATIGLPVKIRCIIEWSAKDEKDWLRVAVKCVQAPEGVKEVMAYAVAKIGEYTNSRFAIVRNVFTSNWGWHFIPQDEELAKLPLDADGGLPIDITVTLYNAKGGAPSSPPISVNEPAAKFQERFLETLQSDMDKLREDPVTSAGAPEVIKLISKDGKEFSANWWVLAARSSVFRNMFQTRMSEAEQGLVKLEDIAGEALDVFLKFLHSATLDDKWKEPGILEEVTRAAHKYGIQDLLDFLDEALALVCSSENYGKLYRLARTLELKKAEKALLEKIQELWREAQGGDKMMQLFDNLDFGN